MQVSLPKVPKKFGAAALASVLSFVGIKLGFAIEAIALVTAPLYTYIVGQGFADFGKEREKIARSTTTVNNS